MCGIAGVAGDGSRSGAAATRTVNAMLGAIQHRGPDANGVRALTGPGDTGATLGAVRLRVIDLDPRADQPMTDAAGGVCTVFNGEIYNFRELRDELEAAGFRFASSSDTECLVHLYRHLDGDIDRIAARLRGMFAFAIWDVTRGRLVIARDRLGIKPLYWARTNDGLAFCSEQRALARAGLVSGQPNHAALAGYLAKGVVNGGMSLLDGVQQLAPGSSITWDGGAPRLSAWWRPTFAPRADLSAAAAAQAELGAAVSDSVQRHLVADRTVGIFLSSGTDSTAVASIASQTGAVNSLTVTFPDDPSFSEGDGASATARRLGTRHTEVPVTASDALAAVTDLLPSLDSPTADGFNSWLISRAAADAGLVVVLSGLGGDELLAGYPTFTSVPRLRRALRAINLIPSSLRASFATTAKSFPRARAWSRALHGGNGIGDAYHLIRRLFDDAEIESTGLPRPGFDGVAGGLSDLDAVSTLELTSYMRDQLLPDADTTSMAHSIELRLPLLDDRFVATVLSLPPALRADGKQMLATAAGMGPRPVKRPFALPMQHWVDSSLRSIVRDALLDDTLPFGDILSARFRQGLWRDVEAGRVHWAKPWAVTVLRLWPQANGFDW